MQTKTKLSGAAAAVVLTALAAAGCGSGKSSHPGAAGTRASKSSTLVGAGSTLVAPLVAHWQSTYGTTHGVTVTYGAIGSGGGIQQLTARTIDFGASDAPLTPDQAKSCKGCAMVPWALAATTVAYNIPGVSRPLRLSGPVIAEMYLGQIKNWNDPSIRKLNPGTKLPTTAVHPVHRSDASGDTYAFTNFLSRVSPAWQSKVGTSTSVSWRTGIGAAKNSGVAAAIESTPGSVGYVAIGDAVGDKLHYASVENRAHAFVKPTTKSIAAAAGTAHFARNNSVSIVDPPASAKTAYPISTFTYALVPRSSRKVAELKAFLTYAVTKGQSFATKLEFAPLPARVVAKDKAIINGL